MFFFRNLDGLHQAEKLILYYKKFDIFPELIKIRVISIGTRFHYEDVLSGILRNPDRTRTRTRTKPGLEKNPDSTLGLTFEKSRTCLQKTRTRLIKKTEFKTGLIKKRGSKSVARQSVICLHLIPEWA